MICNKESLTLKQLETNNNTVKFTFDVSDGLKKYFTTNHLFIEYSKEINLDNIPKSILTIPFVASILPLMWLTDSIMWIDEIDKTFYHSLSRIKAAYQEIYDYFPLKGSLIPAYIIENELSQKRNSLCLFSGGLDANTTYLRHSNENPILFNVQGWYDTPETTNSVSEKDINEIMQFSKSQNRTFLYAKSNFAKIINTNTFNKKIGKKLKTGWWYGFQHSMSFISIAIPVCYACGVKTIYIASSYSLGNKERCASYPTTDSEFQFAKTGTVVHDAFDLSRQDKVKVIVEYQKKTNEIFPVKVCTFNENNCLICEKCIRTMLGIIAENGDVKKFGFNVTEPLLEHFKNSFEKNIIFFDIDGESRKFWGYIKKRMLENYNNLSEKEVVDWFLSENLSKIRKKKVFEYRIKNFFKLVFKRIKKR